MTTIIQARWSDEPAAAWRDLFSVEGPEEAELRACRETWNKTRQALPGARALRYEFRVKPPATVTALHP